VIFSIEGMIRSQAALLVLLLMLPSVGYGQAAAPQFKQLAGPPSEYAAMRPADPRGSATRSKSAMLPVTLEQRGPNLWAWDGEIPVEGDVLRIAVLSGAPGPLPNAWRLTLRELASGRTKSGLDPSVDRRTTPLGFAEYGVPADYYSFPGVTRGRHRLSVESNGGGQGFILIEGGGRARLISHLAAFNQRVGQRITFLARNAEDDQGAGATGTGRIDAATLQVTTPDGRALTETMHDDGLHQDGLPGDGTYGAEFVAEMAGNYLAQVIARGRDSGGGEFVRTTEHMVPVIAASINLDSETATALPVGSHRLQVDLRITAANAAQHYRVVAQVWGTSASPEADSIPVAWIGGMAIPRDGRLELGLDTRWITRAAAKPPFELRNVRIEDPDYFITVAAAERIPLSMARIEPTGSVLDAATVDEEMLMGPRPATPSVETGGIVARQADYTIGSGHKLLLVHGYCAEEPQGPWAPVSDQFGNAAVFADPKENRSHDAFANLIYAFGTPWNSYAIVAHSQGGAAALHLYAYYWSGLDNAGPGSLIQSIGTPYQGTPVAGIWAVVACGPNYDLTPDGAAQWLAGIPASSRSRVDYYTTSFDDSISEESSCWGFTDLLLSDPEDGIVEQTRGQLPGGVNQGHSVGWCHTANMNEPAQTTDRDRNSNMNVNAAGPPIVTITTPTLASTYSTDITPLTIGGTTSATAAVTQVTWANDRGGSGAATGTTNWTASMDLQSGVNVITVTAQDAEAHAWTDSLRVTYGLSEAGEIACGAPIYGDLTSGDQDDYLFYGEPGDVVWVSVVDLGGTNFDPYVGVYRPDGSLAGSVSYADAGTFSLNQTGYYTLRVYDLSGGDAGSYQLRLEWLAPVAKQCTSRPIGCGVPVLGSLGVNDQNLRVFEGTTGDKVWVSLVDTGGVTYFDPLVSVYRPDGSLLGSVSYADAEELLLNQTGVYTLRVYDSGGETGTYQLRLEWIAPAAKQCTAQPIACGTPQAGALTENDQALWTFEGTTGDKVWVSPVDTGGVTYYDPTVTVYRPDGSVLGSVSYADAEELTLNQTGVYTLRVYDSGGDTGTYGLRLEWIAPVAKQCTAQPIACGTPQAGALTENDQALRTFSGTTGDKVWVSLVDTGGVTYFDPLVSVYRPDGSLLGSVSYADAQELVLNQTGVYTLRVYDSGGDTGTYGLRLEWIAPVAKQCTAQPIVCGTPQAGALTENDQALRTFEGTTGDKVWVSLVSTGGVTYYDPTVAVYRPDGSLLGSVSYADAEELVLNQTGVYTLRVYDSGGDTGTYGLRLEWIAPVVKQCTAQPIACGTPQAGALTENDHNLRTFEGTTGDKAWVSLVDTGGVTYYDPTVAVYRPDGSLLASVSYADAEELVLNQTGVYTLRVYDSGGDTGTYGLRLEWIAPVAKQCTRLVIGPCVPLTRILTPNDQQLWGFAGTPTEQVSVSVLKIAGTTSFSPWVGVYRPDGALQYTITSNWTGTLSQSGPYTLRVYDSGGDEGTYQLTFNRDGVPCPDPQVSGIEPAFGPDTGGTAVTITGSAFISGETAFSLGGVPATSVVVLTDTTATAITPPHAAGLVDVTVTIQEKSFTLGNAFRYERRAQGDFDGGGTSDILWRHATAGDLWLWKMKDGDNTSEDYVKTVADQGWEIRGLGDQTGDHKADILWRHAATGTIYLWTMNGSTVEAETYVDTVDTVFDIVGTGDYDGDGKGDILWRHATTGEVWMWLMNGADTKAVSYVDMVDLAYTVQGSGDLDKDGKDDLVWRHATQGDAWVWLMNGPMATQVVYVSTVAELSYRIVGVADYTGDGKADLLWHHDTRGEVWLWTMEGTTNTGQSYVDIVPDVAYRVVGTGDYDGNGKADILWHHAARGEVWVWLMNGAVKQAVHQVGTVPDVGYRIIR
jgi:hypothetical protein